MTDKEFIAGIISGEHNQNDVQERCKGDGYNTKALFLAMYAAAPAIFQRHGVAPCLWIESARRFDLQGAGLQMYQDPDFVRLQNAMAVAEACLEDAEERPTAAKADADSTKAGTPRKKDISAYFENDGERAVKALHTLLKGKSGTQAAAYLMVAVANNHLALCKGFLAACAREFCLQESGYKALTRKFRSYFDVNGNLTSQGEKCLQNTRNALQKAMEDDLQG